MATLRSQLPQRVAGMKSQARVLINRAADSHVAIAKELAPVDRGFMRDHIEKLQGGFKFDLSALRFRDRASGQFVGASSVGLDQVQVISAAPYSAYVEFGTVVHDPQPFFRPAFASAVRQMRAEAKAVING